MEDNLKKILAEFDNWKGQFVITMGSFAVERLVAIGDDGDDWYYVTYNGRDLKWQSCVIGLIPLKGYIKDEDYNYIVRNAKLNHSDQLALEKDGNLNDFLPIVYSNDKIIAGFCWDLI